MQLSEHLNSAEVVESNYISLLPRQHDNFNCERKHVSAMDFRDEKLAEEKDRQVNIYRSTIKSTFLVRVFFFFFFFLKTDSKSLTQEK